MMTLKEIAKQAGIKLVTYTPKVSRSAVDPLTKATTKITEYLAKNWAKCIVSRDGSDGEIAGDFLQIRYGTDYLKDDQGKVYGFDVTDVDEANQGEFVTRILIPFIEAGHFNASITAVQKRNSERMKESHKKRKQQAILTQIQNRKKAA